MSWAVIHQMRLASRLGPDVKGVIRYYMWRMIRVPIVRFVPNEPNDIPEEARARRGYLRVEYHGPSVVKCDSACSVDGSLARSACETSIDDLKPAVKSGRDHQVPRATNECAEPCDPVDINTVFVCLAYPLSDRHR